MADNQQDVKGIGDRGTGERLKFLRDSSGRIVSDEGHSRLGTFRDGEFQGFVDRVQLDPVEITPTPKPRPPVTKVRKPQATKEAVRSTTPVDRGLETKEAILNFFERGEVVRCEHLSLDNGEVDLNLIEPTGMDRAVDGHDFGIGRLKTFDRGSATMGGTVVDDPKHTAGLAVRGLVHDLSH